MHLLILTVAALAVCSGDSLFAQAGQAATGWAQVPEILKRIVPPVFPDREFVLTKFGAVGDGNTDCTQAFADAIAACAQAGGGRVVVPAGRFLTGAIHLRSNVDLHVSKDATILFSTDPEKFLPPVFSRDVAEMMNYSPFIYALDQENIAITGEGTLDGQGSKSVWYQWKKTGDADIKQLTEMGDREVPVGQRIFGEGHRIRPCFVQPTRCRNVLIEGVRIVDSPNWVLHPLYCTNVTVRGVAVDTGGPNTDGCDPDSCRDVLIKDCSFSDGDDCIAVKSGRDHDGRRVNLPSQDVVIQNCVFARGHGGITMGSENSGGIRNIFAEDCRLNSPDLDMALRFKTDPTRGGYIEDIYIRRCTVQTARTGIHMTMKYSKSATGDFIPTVRNIDIRDTTFLNLTRQAIFIEGLSDTAKITDVTITGCNFGNAPSANFIANADRVNLIHNHGGGLD
jgi:polygalacturonase